MFEKLKRLPFARDVKPEMVPAPPLPMPATKLYDQYLHLHHRLRRHFYNKALELAEPGETVVLHSMSGVADSHVENDLMFYVYGLKRVREGRVDFLICFLPTHSLIKAPKPWAFISARDLLRNDDVVFLSKICLPTDVHQSIAHLLEGEESPDFLGLIKEMTEMEN